GALEKIVAAFDRDPDLDVISGHGYFVTEAGQRGAPVFSDRWDTRRFRNGACVLVQPATFFRREAFVRAGGLRTTGRICWDMELWADLCAAGARFGIIDEFLAAFRLHRASITGDARHARVRRLDARSVMAEMKGRRERIDDRISHLWFRGLK